MKKQRTLSFRLAVGFAILVVLNAVATLIFVSTLRRVEAEITSVAEESLPAIERMAQIQKDTLNYRILTNRHVLSDDLSEKQQLDAQCDEIAQKLIRQIREYQAFINTAEEKELVARVEPSLNAFRAVAKEIRALSREQKDREAFKLLKTDGAKAYHEFESAVTACAVYNDQAARSLTAGVKDDTTRSLRTSLLLGLVSAVAAIAAGWLISRNVNALLRATAFALDDAAAQVAAAARQVSAGSQGLAQGSSEQAASLEETSSSLEELASMTKRNADHAISAKALSAETRAAAETGNNDVLEMRRAMDAIKGSSNDISKIIKTIDEIAFQTNILALNAAVEAARAGEAGAGFAVVADEVRALAQRSATAAKETAAKIEDSIARSEHGVIISGKVATSLGVIVEKARRVDTLVGEISTASTEQSQGINQINAAVGQMDKVTQTNAGNAEETAAAAEELTAQSASLRESVLELRQLVGGHAGSAEARTPRISVSAPPPAPHEVKPRMIRPAIGVTSPVESDVFFKNA